MLPASRGPEQKFRSHEPKGGAWIRNMTTCTGAADLFPKTSLFCFETKTKRFAVKIKLYPPSVEWRHKHAFVFVYLFVYMCIHRCTLLSINTVPYMPSQEQESCRRQNVEVRRYVQVHTLGNQPTRGGLARHLLST